MDDEWSVVTSIKKTKPASAVTSIKRELFLNDPTTQYVPNFAHGTFISKDKQNYYGELEFLNLYAGISKRILYFRTKHSAYLSKLITKFPNNIWIIINDEIAPLSELPDSVIILNKSSIDKDFIGKCHESDGGGFLLISNIFDTDQDIRTAIAEQNTMLQKYGADISLVRFRAPYPKTVKDIIRIPQCIFKFIICPKADSTETNLIIFKENLKTPLTINCSHYEQLLAYHNQVRRANHLYDQNNLLLFNSS